ncbi:hypothetical protein AVEN_114258-1 [Araneus ventricosus]|uniref:Uncharacterized protein n=1 Tax=Araneus ventricosus TaxID=182803 RepID=A0A4Y2MF19_ARAVE|nr:hypothetical protein AVEN_114258-1 [Araneus ventricosus]
MKIESFKKWRNALRQVFTTAVNSLKEELSKNVPNKGFLKAKLSKLQEMMSELRNLDNKIQDVLAIQDVSVDELVADMDICDEYRDEFITLEILTNESLADNNVIPKNNSYEYKLGDSVNKENRYELSKSEMKEACKGISDTAPKNKLPKEGHDIPQYSIADPKNLISKICPVSEISIQTGRIISCNDYPSTDMNIRELPKNQVDPQCEIEDENEIREYPEIQILRQIDYSSLVNQSENLFCDASSETSPSENFQIGGSGSETVPRTEVMAFSAYTPRKSLPRRRWENPQFQRETPQTDPVSRDCFVTNEL